MCMGRFGWVEFHSINQSNRNLVGAYQTFKCMDKMKHALSRKHMPKAHILAWNLWWKYISKTNTYCKMRMLWNISKYNLQVKMIGSPPKSWIWWCYRHRSHFFCMSPLQNLNVDVQETTMGSPGCHCTSRQSRSRCLVLFIFSVGRLITGLYQKQTLREKKWATC